MIDVSEGALGEQKRKKHLALIYAPFVLAIYLGTDGQISCREGDEPYALRCGSYQICVACDGDVLRDNGAQCRGHNTLEIHVAKRAYVSKEKQNTLTNGEEEDNSESRSRLKRK